MEKHEPEARFIGVKKISRILSFLFLLVILSGLNATRAGAAAPDPAQVKAAFVYNFSKFVFWPPETLPPGAHEITLCILGDDPLGDALESLAGKTANGRLLSIKRSIRREEASSCQILYVCRSESKQMRDILRSVKDGVLTIGDIKNFASAGGIINFVLINDRISFEINPDAAEAGGIRISSQLLRLAKIVRKDSQ